jgi:hypothetical protein
MSNKKKPVDGAHLSDAIRSLQNLLDDVSTEQVKTKETSIPAADASTTTHFDETTEFDMEPADAVIPVADDDNDMVDIDSHFDMNIPPALPDEDDQEGAEHVIPTLSETIVAGDIPVLNEIVQLPDGEMIPEPDPNMTLEMAIQSGNLPTPISDASEAASDAVQIILARFHSKKLTPEIREQIKAAVTEILMNSPELEIPDTIV